MALPVARVGRYVLMPDHLHVFLTCTEASALSRWVGGLKGVLVARWRKAGQQGPFWQEGFFDHLLRGEESYEEKWAYVLNNPVRKGLVHTGQEWPFGSEIDVIRWGG